MLAACREREDLIWLLNGGGATLASFGIDDPRRLPADVVAWVDSLPLSFDDGRRFFVHAGVNPALPLDQQNEYDQVWIREPFLLSNKDFGRLIVHGHTPLAGGLPELRPNRLNLDTAAVMGGPLTAAVFKAGVREPVDFLTDDMKS
jgi:serine/threonine protein phosphatase 1